MIFSIVTFVSVLNLWPPARAPDKMPGISI
jgi:hypothetical protein